MQFLQHAFNRRIHARTSPSQPSRTPMRAFRMRLPGASASSPGLPWTSSADRDNEVIDVKAIEVVGSSGSRASSSQSSSPPPESAPASTSAVSDADAPDGDWQPWPREQRRAEAMQRLLTRRLRQIRSGQWLNPPTPHSSETLLGSEGRDRSQAGAGVNPAEGDKLSLAVRSPMMTYLLACTAAVVLIQQWWPLLPLLLERAQQLDFAPLAAFALVVPDTPAAASWQLDVMAVSAGNWGSIWTSCFVHSGLLPFMLCLASFLEVGSMLEGAFGGLVLLLHFGLCGLGAALAQMTLQPLIFGIAGPGVAAGLVVSLLVHQARLRSEGLLEELRVTPLSACILVMCPLLAMCQPLLGLWGLLGACLGGALAALTSFALLNALRYCIFGPLYLAVCALEIAFKAVAAVPKAVTFCITGLVRVTVQLLAVVASTIRDIK